MKIKHGDIVTVVDNETGEEVTGKIIEYTPNRISLVIQLDAKNVHFKETNKRSFL
ncbi:hypothetical protein [Robertmurraya siralis]|uniref:hypothetical protein n=1 Tax=Robertmurraya siralis TaxID=77777 RepID=UPI0014775D32|nr:hypothetical protein [Robertmurraya siralis]